MIREKIISKRLFFIVIPITVIALFFIIYLFKAYKIDDKAAQKRSINNENGVILKFVNWASSEKASKGKVDFVLQEFMRLNPNIIVENIPIPFEDYQKQLIILTNQGKDPDVFQLNGNWVVFLANKGILQNLNNIPEIDKYIKDNYSEIMLEACKYNENLYAIPYALTPHAFWYNKVLMEKAGINRVPVTIEELNVDLKKIKEKLPGVYGIGIDTSMLDYSLIQNWHYFNAFGARDLLVDIKNPGFDQKPILDLLRWFKMLGQNGYTPIDTQIKIQRIMMANNLIVFKLDGPYLKGTLQSININLIGENFDRIFGVSHIPTKAGIKPSSVTDIHSLSISRSSCNKEAAWKLIEYLASNPVSVKNYILPMGVIPPQKSSIDENKNILNSLSYRIFLTEIIPSAKLMPYSPEFTKAGRFVINGINKVFHGESPEKVQLWINDSIKKLSAE